MLISKYLTVLVALKHILTNNTYNKPQKGGCRKRPPFFCPNLHFLAWPQNFHLVEKKYMLGSQVGNFGR